MPEARCICGLGDVTVPGFGVEDGEPIYGLDLGSGVFVSPIADRDDHLHHVGAMVWHTHADGRVCSGAIWFEQQTDHEHPIWTVEQWDPLTVTPSVRAMSGPGMSECLHGWIRAGRWVPA